MAFDGNYRSSYVSPTATDARRGTITENYAESLRMEKLRRDVSVAEMSATAHALSPSRRYSLVTADNWGKYVPTANLPTNVPRTDNIHVNSLRAPRQEVIYPGHYGGGNTYSRHTNIDNFVEERPGDFSDKSLLRGKGTYMTETMARQQHAQRVYAEQVARQHLVDNRDRVSAESDHRSVLANSLRGSASIVQPSAAPSSTSSLAPRELWGTGQGYPSTRHGATLSSSQPLGETVYRTVSHIAAAGDKPEFQATRRPKPLTPPLSGSPSKWSAPRPAGAWRTEYSTHFTESYGR